MVSKSRGAGDGCGCGDGDGRLRVVSMVSVDARGQMVLPKELRERAGIRPGDQLAVLAWERRGRTCCISLIGGREFEGLARKLLGPMMRTMLSKEG